jgi:acetolactate synthase-1/3 small subunit
MRRILSVLLENEPGALSRVVGLFSQRGYNIETLNVAPIDDHSMSRLTVTTSGDELKIEQITKNLNKIIDVIKVVELTDGAHVERDTLLVKVRAEGSEREEVKRTVEIFRGQIIDVGPVTYIIQLTGPSEKLDSFLEALGATEILEVVRSGVAGLARGEKILAS